MVSPLSGRFGDADTSFCLDVVGANGDAVGRSEGANVGRSVALTGNLVGLKVFGCSVGGKAGLDFSSLLSRKVKTHTKATIRPTRKKTKPTKEECGLLVPFLRGLPLPPASSGCDEAEEPLVLSFSFMVHADISARVCSSRLNE